MPMITYARLYASRSSTLFDDDNAEFYASDVAPSFTHLI